MLQTAASLRTFCLWVIFTKIAHPVSVRSWSRSPVIMATRKSLAHREQKRGVARSIQVLRSTASKNATISSQERKPGFHLISIPFRLKTYRKRQYSLNPALRLMTYYRLVIQEIMHQRVKLGLGFDL